MPELPLAVKELGQDLRDLGGVRDLLVAGSLATGDYVPGVSDLDLVAVVAGPWDCAALAALHRTLDDGPAAGLHLGCAYVSEPRLLDLQALHPTWTHGRMTERILSGVTRAELVRHGAAVFGRPPQQVFPGMSNDAVREAARAEVLGYWAWAARRPWLWLDQVIADLGLTSMARARHTLGTGELLSKTRAVEQADAPAWLVDQVRARRHGGDVRSPRLRTAALAWRDARRTVALARRRADDVSAGA